MAELPNDSVLVRTWFGDDHAWEELVTQVQTPSRDGFLAGVRCIDERAFEGLTADALKAGQPHGPIVSFIADRTTLTGVDHPIMAVWVLPPIADDDRPAPTPFRVVPSELWGVENNINLSNMDWEDFAGSVDADGVFRGF